MVGTGTVPNDKDEDKDNDDNKPSRSCAVCAR